MRAMILVVLILSAALAALLGSRGRGVRAIATSTAAQAPPAVAERLDAVVAGKMQPLEPQAHGGKPRYLEPPPAPAPLYPPMGLGFAEIADELREVFPALDLPPENPAMAREFHGYTSDLSSLLHLEGERDDLSLVRLTLFDRSEAPPERLEAQAETVRRFLRGSLEDGDALAAEVLAFLAQPRAGAEGTVPQRAWSAGERTLLAAVHHDYGMVVLEVNGE